MENFYGFIFGIVGFLIIMLMLEYDIILKFIYFLDKDGVSYKDYKKALTEMKK